MKTKCAFCGVEKPLFVTKAINIDVVLDDDLDMAVDGVHFCRRCLKVLYMKTIE